MEAECLCNTMKSNELVLGASHTTNKFVCACVRVCVRTGQYGSMPFKFEGIALICNIGYCLFYRLIFCGLE